MWVSIALCVAAALVSAVCAAECGACIHGQCYRKHHLPNVKGRALDIDRNANILYVKDGKTIRQCQLETSVCNEIANTNNINSLTIDQRTGYTYGILQGSSLYKMDLLDNTKILLVHGEVYYSTFKDRLYYSTTSYDGGIHSYENGETRQVNGTEGYSVYNFIVDKNDDIYFKKATYASKVIKRLSKGEVDESVYGDDSYFITVDRDGNAVFINEKSHAVYRVTDGQVVEVGVIDDSIYQHEYDTPLFDKDNNVIYKTFSNDYFHLKRDRGVNCTYSILQDEAIITETVATTENSTENDLTSTTPPYNTETTTNRSPDGNIEVNVNVMFPSTTESTTSSSPDESGASPSGAPGQQSHAGHEQQSSCSCRFHKLPNISIKIKFN